MALVNWCHFGIVLVVASAGLVRRCSSFQLQPRRVPPPRRRRQPFWRPFRRIERKLSDFAGSSQLFTSLCSANFDGDNDNTYDNILGNSDNDDPIVAREECDETRTKMTTEENYNDRLRRNTESMLDEEVIPIGSLTSDDVSAICGLMLAWTKTRMKLGAQNVERLLKRVIDEINAGNTEVTVTTRMYTIAIDSWSKSNGGLEAAERAQAIHDKLVETYEVTGDELIETSTVSYNALLNAWSKSKSPYGPIKAENILREMITNYRNGNKGVAPDVVSFTSVIDTYAKTGGAGAGKKGLELLSEMEEMAADDEELRPNLQPNAFIFSASINAFAKSPDVDAPERAEELLTQMKERYEQGEWRLRPTVVMYNSIINAYGRSKVRGSAKRATEILERLVLPVEEGGDEISPDELSWSLAVSAWTHSDEPGSLEESEKILLRMERWAIDERRKLEKEGALPHRKLRLDIDCYNSVLAAISRSQEHDAPRRALRILRRMIHLGEKQGFSDILPNSRSWNSVLNSFSRTREKGMAAKAENVLKFMIREGNRPDRYSFAAVLIAYQKNSEPGSAVRADAIVRHMQKLHLAGELEQGPDVYHFSILVSCWARSNDRIAARRSKQILNYMISQWKAGENTSMKPNIKTYNSVIDAHARSRDVEEAEAYLDYLVEESKRDPSLTPDSFSFQSVINAWTRSRRRDGPSRAEQVLDKLLQFHRERETIKPGILTDSRSFSQIIHCYSRRKDQRDSAIKAEARLNMMIALFQDGYQSLEPNTLVFANVINAHANSRQPDAGKNAERVQNLMIDFGKRHSLSKIQSNAVISNAVIAAWAASGDNGAGEIAEKILDTMESSYEDGNEEMKPNGRTYAGVINAWAKSRSSVKAQRAHDILCRMKSSTYCKPSCLHASLCINACAFIHNGSEKERKDAFEIARSVLNELSNCHYDQPNSFAFGTFIKSLGRLGLPLGTVTSNIESAFQQAAELGLVDDFVLTQLRYSCPSGLYRKLLGSDVIPNDGPEKIVVELSKVPFEWRRNVDPDSGRNRPVTN